MDKAQEKIPTELIDICDLAQEGLCLESKRGKCPYPDDYDKCGLCFAEYLQELGYRKPLDRPKLEKEIADMIGLAQCSVCGKSGDICKGCAYLAAAPILAYLILILLTELPKERPPLLSNKHQYNTQRLY